jgi:branched-chain amino acid ABC superfamily ATP binding cassette transporter, permease protein
VKKMQRFHKKNIRWTLFALGMYALLFVLVQTGVINFYYESTFINIMINIIYAVGLNLILGVAGQFSLGHAGFIAIGSYSGAILGKMMNGLPGLFAGMAVGVVISVIVAFLVGLPTLRLKGDYLAIATLGVAGNHPRSRDKHENHKRCCWYQRGAFDKHMDDYVYRSRINNNLNLELHIQ